MVQFSNKKRNSTGYTVKDWGKRKFGYSLTTMNNCVVKDSLLAGIYDTPTSLFDFVDNPGDQCAGYSREILYKGNAGQTADFTWDFGGCTSEFMDWNRLRVSFPPFGQQPWVSLAVKENGCLSDTTRQAFGASPNFTLNTDKSMACDSELIQFSGKLNVLDKLDFSWDFGDGSTSTGQFPTHLYNMPGFYDVGLVITNPITGCKAGFTVENMVKIFQTPVARFRVDYPEAILGHARLTFDNQTLYGDGNTAYTWDFGDHTPFSTDVNPQHTYDQVGEFPVTLMAESGTESGVGCIDSAMMTVKILPYNLFTPNAFRPDSGIPDNQTFMPITLGVDPALFHLQIFNRWGEMVFESKSLENKWDGKLKNGQEAPMGNYIWKADYTDIQGFSHTRRGQVLLIR